MGFALLVLASAVGMAIDSGRVIAPQTPIPQKQIYYIEASSTPPELGSAHGQAVTDKAVSMSDRKVESPEDIIPVDNEAELSSF